MTQEKEGCGSISTFVDPRGKKNNHSTYNAPIASVIQLTRALLTSTFFCLSYNFAELVNIN